MKEIINKLIKELVNDGWDAITNNKKQILKQDGKEFIINLLNNPNLRYSHAPAIFLIIPEIWKDFSLNDWKYVIRNVNRPPKYRLFMDDEASFEDIKFLYNWIGIDSLKLCKEDDGLTSEKKASIDRVFPSFLVDIIKHDDGNEEDFADGTFGKKEYFITMKQRLLSQGATSV